MEKAIIFIGIQASGKTSFYRRFLSEYVHISLDVLNTRNKEKILIEKCIENRESFVIDNTNPTREDRKRYIDILKNKGYRIVGYYFRSSIGESIERNSGREGKANVPKTAILCTSKKLELPSFDEGFDELYYVHIENSGFVVDKWSEEV